MSMMWEVKKGNTLSEIADTIKRARNLDSSISTIVDILVKENGLESKDKILYGRKLNVGLMTKFGKYSLYRNVTIDVKNHINNSKHSVNGITINNFFNNVRRGGSWDIGNTSLSYLKTSECKYFYFNDWKYNDGLVTYEDIQNMVYGALGKHVSSFDFGHWTLNRLFNFLDFFDTSLNEIMSVRELKEMFVGECLSSSESKDIISFYLYGDELLSILAIGLTKGTTKLVLWMVKILRTSSKALSLNEDMFKTYLLNFFLEQHNSNSSRRSNCLRMGESINRSRVNEAIRFGYSQL